MSALKINPGGGNVLLDRKQSGGNVHLPYKHYHINEK